MTLGFKCVRTHSFCKLARAWRTQENLCAHKIAQARTGPHKNVFAAPEISGRSAILSRVVSDIQLNLHRIEQIAINQMPNLQFCIEKSIRNQSENEYTGWRRKI